MGSRVGQVVQPVDLVVEDDLHVYGQALNELIDRRRSIGGSVEDGLRLNHPPALPEQTDTPARPRSAVAREPSTRVEVGESVPWLSTMHWRPPRRGSRISTLSERRCCCRWQPFGRAEVPSRRCEREVEQARDRARHPADARRTALPSQDPNIGTPHPCLRRRRGARPGIVGPSMDRDHRQPCTVRRKGQDMACSEASVLRPGDCQRAGVSPWRCITSSTAGISGGPSTLMMAARSRK
jgi:hypothetical protein